MGWCQEFGLQINDECGHSMRAGSSSCACTACGTVCGGRFSGCELVWERGPRDVDLERPLVPEVRRRSHVVGRADVDPVVAETVEEARGEVLEWLETAFDGMRDDLATVMRALDRQQKMLEPLAATEEATARLVELADRLPGRLAEVMTRSSTEAEEARALESGELRRELQTLLPDSIAEAARSLGPPADAGVLDRVDEVAAELRRSLAEVHSSAADLRNEMARLAAFRRALAADQPALAQAVEGATHRAETRLVSLAQRMESLAERPEWQAVRARLPFRRDQNGGGR